MLGFPHFIRLLITFYGLRSWTFFTAGGRGDPKFFSSKSWNYVFTYHQCKLMIAYFSLLEKILCREFSSSPNNFLKPGICCGNLYIISVEMFSTCQYIRANRRSCLGRRLSETDCWKHQSQDRWSRHCLQGRRVMDAVITPVNCNHIQSTKEMTMNGVYSFYFLLCMILYIWLFFFP